MAHGLVTKALNYLSAECVYMEQLNVQAVCRVAIDVCTFKGS